MPATLLNAQTPLPTPQELDQLLAPVALYPDALLAQITTASTNPQEILDVDNWLHQNAGLQGPALADAAQAQGFDPAFIALTAFPQVLDMMAQNIDDYAAIGEAFEANQGVVMDSVQRLRQEAYADGALRSNAQQQVVMEAQDGRQIIVIQPANPQFVYLPQYDPAVVFGGAAIGTGVFITFGAGIALGVALGPSHPWGWGGWGWNWGRRTALYNRSPWVVRNNHYRPTRSTFRPQPPNYQNRPVFGGNRNNRPGQPQGRPAPARPNNTLRPAPTPNRQNQPPSRTAPNQPQVRPAPARPNQPNNTLRPAPAPNRQYQPPSRTAPNQPQVRPAPTRPNQPNNTLRPAPAPNRQNQPPNRTAPNQPQARPAPARPNQPNNTLRPAPAPNRENRPPDQPAPKQ